jgi:hypothetical protein
LTIPLARRFCTHTRQQREILQFIGTSRRRHQRRAASAPEACKIAQSARLLCPRLRRKVAIWFRREDALGRGIMESSMSKAGLDNRHRNKDGEISHKHGNTLIRTLRKVYGQSFAAGYPETAKLSEVLLQLNETSLSQLRRDHETGHLEHKIANASK